MYTTPTLETLTWEQWEEKYQPIANTIVPREEVNGWLFETYGREVDYIKSLARNPETSGTVWTYMTDDFGNLCIANGCHFINRIGYFITAIPCPENVQVFVQDQEDVTI